MATKLRRVSSQPENPFSALVQTQQIAIVPSFTLESGVTLHNAPLAYATWGTLSPNKNNVMIICHALTGSSDVSDWWGPLLGAGRAFDTSRFFIICMNSLGSPYGSASPCTYKDGDESKGKYGPEFPLTTVRDDVNFHKILLDDLGITQVAVAIGGSMGGMLVLEWAFFGKEYVRSFIALATSSRHSAWCISWGEAQRQSIYSDPKYDDGYYPYDDPPTAGLGAARMQALLTYRSRNSFESRFGRQTPDTGRLNGATNSTDSPEREHWEVHNHGHKRVGLGFRANSSASLSSIQGSSDSKTTTPNTNGDATKTTNGQSQGERPRKSSHYFSAQSYLRYQGDKFVKRFDSNCYIAITRKLDQHDLSRGRADPDDPDGMAKVLGTLQQPALIVGIASDGLFTFDEQQELAAGIPDAELERIDSPEGHDAFLLQFEQINRYALRFLNKALPDIMSGEPIDPDAAKKEQEAAGKIVKDSTFGEAEVEDIVAW